MSRKFSLILLLIVMLAFGVGVTQLFKMRFETGDVYPEYSSLRSDPLGASAFYESLEQLPGVSVRRDYQNDDRLPEGNETAYLHLAGNQFQWTSLPESTFKEMESFVRQGGRLVVAFLPQTTKPYESPFAKKKKPDEAKSKKTDDKDASKSDPDPKKSKKPDDESDLLAPTVSLKDLWGISFKFKEMSLDEKGALAPVEVETGEPGLPPSISWYSGVVFTNLNKAWRVVYTRDSEPVLIERRFGSGSVVFSSDSFFISNEAMQKERHADLLSWLVGPSRRIVFDEAHLGIVQSPGIASLIRQYRLHGLVLGLLMLAGLFIWKNSVPFAPVRDDAAIADFVPGKDSASGFVNLLRRHVSSRNVLSVCLAEWQKSFARGKYSAARMERVATMINAENARSPMDRNPVATYRAICQALKQNLPVSNVESKPTK